MRGVLPVPMPDPGSIAGWPAAAVAITIVVGFVAIQIANLWVTVLVRVKAGDAASHSDVADLAAKFDRHVEDDAEWKRGIEERLPASTL